MSFFLKKTVRVIKSPRLEMESSGHNPLNTTADFNKHVKNVKWWNKTVYFFGKYIFLNKILCLWKTLCATEICSLNMESVGQNSLNGIGHFHGYMQNCKWLIKEVQSPWKCYIYFFLFRSYFSSNLYVSQQF